MSHPVPPPTTGREHVWEAGDVRVGLEPRVTRDGEPYQRLTITRDGQTLVAGRVDTVDQAVDLLAAYGLLARRDVLGEIQRLLREDYETCRAVVAVLRRPAPDVQDPDWTVADRVLCAIAAHISRSAPLALTDAGRTEHGGAR